jgi:hypothetical protein
MTPYQRMKQLDAIREQAWQNHHCKPFDVALRAKHARALRAYTKAYRAWLGSLGSGKAPVDDGGLCPVLPGQERGAA